MSFLFFVLVFGTQTLRGVRTRGRVRARVDCENSARFLFPIAEIEARGKDRSQGGKDRETEGKTREPALNMLHDARFASRFLFLLPFFFFFSYSSFRTSTRDEASHRNRVSKGFLAPRVFFFFFNH